MNYPQIGIYILAVSTYVGGSSVLLLHSPPELETPHPETEQSYSAPEKPTSAFVGSGSGIVETIGQARGTSEVTGRAPAK